MLVRSSSCWCRLVHRPAGVVLFVVMLVLSCSSSAGVGSFVVLLMPPRSSSCSCWPGRFLFVLAWLYPAGIGSFVVLLVLSCSSSCSPWLARRPAGPFVVLLVVAHSL